MMRQDNTVDSNFSLIVTGPMDSRLYISPFVSCDTADLITEDATARASDTDGSLTAGGGPGTAPPCFFFAPGRLF